MTLVPQAAISASNLGLCLKDRYILQGFTASIEPGQFVGVFGPNGAGKTTLLRCFLGLVPWEGDLVVLGRSPRGGHPQVGYMPQMLPTLQVRISGRALLAAAVSGHTLGLPALGCKMRAKVNHVIELTGISDVVDEPFVYLSGGHQRRLMLAQALLGDPHLLLLDEPLANLDPAYQHTFVECLSGLCQALGVTILLTSHDINPLIGVITQVLYLARGQAAVGSVESVLNSESLSALYDAPIEVIRDHHGRMFVIHTHTGQIENVACHV